MPPTARLRATPPKISNPSTCAMASAARSAVIVKWFLSTIPRRPAALKSCATSMSSTERGRESGPACAGEVDDPRKRNRRILGRDRKGRQHERKRDRDRESVAHEVVAHRVIVAQRQRMRHATLCEVLTGCLRKDPRQRIRDRPVRSHQPSPSWRATAWQAAGRTEMALRFPLPPPTVLPYRRAGSSPPRFLLDRTTLRGDTGQNFHTDVSQRRAHEAPYRRRSDSFR